MSHFWNIGHHLIVAIIDHIPNGWVMFNGDMTNDPCLRKGVQNLWLIFMVWYGLKHSFGGDCIILFCLVVTGTWSLLNFIFPNSWDDDPIWRTHIFQRGWNHQPVFILFGGLETWILFSPIVGIQYGYYMILSYFFSGHFRNRLIGGTYQEPKLEVAPF